MHSLSNQSYISMVTFWEFSSCIENELIGKQNWLNNDFPFVFANYGETNLNKIGV